MRDKMPTEASGGDKRGSTDRGVTQEQSNSNDSGKKYPLPTGGESTSPSGALVISGPSNRDVTVWEGELGVADRTSEAQRPLRRRDNQDNMNT